jgi:protein-S-isoprenylcysteine O-methyltransferase Ste14
LFGEVVFTIAVLEFLKTPIDEPVIRGVYRFSRHPVYVAMYLIFLGAGVASASWIFLAYSIFYIVLQSILVVPEEKFCLDKYGDAYREYMNKTPRYIC